MLQKAKTWDFASRFIWRQNRLKKGTPGYKRGMTELGVWTRERLVDLGPTFVKLGQLASTRRDLYEPEFIDELQYLQDQVPPISGDDVLSIIENDIPMELFNSFEIEPFKSASLGQVHLATLTTGVDVVVKIQRPGIDTIVDSDIKNIIEILTVFDALGIDTGPSAKELFIEATSYLYKEMDYISEAENAIRFYNNFLTVPWVRIPRVYTKILSKNVLVMERVDATKITDVTENKVQASKALVSSFLTQIMAHGLFHGDPHPGNVGVNDMGQLVYYDFGLVVELDLTLKDRLVSLVPMILQKDSRGIVDTLIDMKVITPTADKSDIVTFINVSLEFLEEMSGKEFNAKLAQDELSKNLAEEKPFQIPSDFIFLGKSFTTIDGICQQLDPNFNFIDYIQPMVEDDVRSSINLGDITRTSIEMPSRIKSINESVLEIEKSRNKMRRSIERSRNEMKTVQYSILCAILADKFVDNPLVFGGLVFASMFFLINSQSIRR